MKKANAQSFQIHKQKRMKKSMEYAKTPACKKYRREWAKRKYQNDPTHRSTVISRAVAYEKQRLYKDTEFRLQHNLRSNFRKFLRNGIKTKRVVELLKCSWDELCQHLQKQFKPNMTFENYGSWHVDHIIPCKAFSTDEQHYCWWYMNLQPLWKEENFSKGGSYNEEDKQKLIQLYKECHNLS